MMISQTIAAFAVCIVASAAPTLAVGQDEKMDAIREELAQEVEAFRKRTTEAEAELQTALRERIDKISTRLTTDEMLEQRKVLEQQVAAFKSDCSEPDDRRLRSATKRFRKKIETATDRCFKAHTKAADAFAKARNLDEAEAIHKERDELLAEFDFEAKKRQAQLREWFPVGTTISCHRTRSNGPSREPIGAVIENTGTRLTVEASGIKTVYLWKFRTNPDGTLVLAEVSKKNPRARGGVLLNCSSELRIDVKGISGDYSWELQQPDGKPAKLVSGVLTWRVIKRP